MLSHDYIHIYLSIYIYIHTYDWFVNEEKTETVNKLTYLLRNIVSPKKIDVNYLLRKYYFPFENMKVSKKVNYLLRKYDLFNQEYAKVTPKWDELSFVECILGKQFTKIVSPRGRPNS